MTRQEQQLQHTEVHARISKVKDIIGSNEEKVTSLRSAHDRLLTRRNSYSSEISELNRRRADIEGRLQDADISCKGFSDEKQRIQSQLVEVTTLITQCEGELRKIEPVYTTKSASSSELNQQIVDVKHRVEALYGKQGRGQQFNSKKDRDSFLQTQITALEGQIQDKEEVCSRTNRELAKEEDRLNKESDFLVKADAENKSRSARYDELTAFIKDKVSHRNDLQEQRKSSWRKLETIQEQLQEAKDELERAKNQLSVTLPKQVSQGLVTVQKIVAEKQLSGYFGPLIDNILLKNDVFKTAVEVAAGNALFHVIVDTDKTAAILIEELERRKSGRLTFIPLNAVKVPDVQYPDSNDVRPLIDVAIDYDPDVEKAIKHVFGKKLLARDLETAAHFSNEFQLDATTIEGDLVNRNGAFEGGYHDDRSSRIGSVQKIKNATNKITELTQAETQVKRESDSIEGQVNELMRELQKAETEREHIRSNGEQLFNELANRSKQLAAGKSAVASRRLGLDEMQKEIGISRAQIAEFKQEMKQPLLSKLSAGERAELDELSTRLVTLQKSLEANEAEYMAVNSKREQLKADLNNNLLKRRDELQAKLSTPGESGIRDYSVELAALKDEKAHVTQQLAVIEVELDQVASQCDAKVEEINKLEKIIEENREQERLCQEELTEATKMQDKLLNKRTILLETVQQKQQMIRELGTIPRKELEAYKELTEKELFQKLKSTNEKLKKYSGVNRKAMDQYISFNEQRETLITRKEELAKDSDAINKLVESLDAQREEAILRTFRGVSHHFEEVFAELVPGGKGQLVMRTTADELLELDDASRAGVTASSISTFQGIQVRVTFTGSGQQFEMQQLSGGQKALVALALIFAIQRCDPAPFYLFDELDQALDANYRAGVAKLIQKQVNSTDAPAQFITTTFRPELVSVSNQCYGIALVNKVSNIVPITKTEAQNFVNSLMQEEVGKISDVSKYTKEELYADADEDEREPREELYSDQDEADTDDDAVDDVDLDELADVQIGKQEEEVEEEEEEEVKAKGQKRDSRRAKKAPSPVAIKVGRRMK